MIATASPQIEWRAVVGFGSDRYEVSIDGQLRSIKTGRVYKSRIDKRTGYPTGTLFRNSQRKDVFMRSVVAAAFIGPRPEGYMVNHIDGVKTNNHASNLEYVTPSENVRHAHANGLTNPQPGSRKLTDEQVLEIRRILAERKTANARKPTYTEIGAQFGVTEYAIYRIGSGRDYKRLLPTAGGAT